MTDLTLDPRFADLVGITQAELETNLAEYLLEIEQKLNYTRPKLLQLIKTWYNGYSWDGATFLYNPFSLLSFLIELLKDRNVFAIERTEVGQAAFDSFNIENIDVCALLFQTGYLTIKSKEEFGIYVLDYPNREAKDSILQYLKSVAEWKVEGE